MFHKNPQKGQTLILAIIIILIIGSVMLVGGVNKQPDPIQSDNPVIGIPIVSTSAPSAGGGGGTGGTSTSNPNLQLNTFGFTAATPTLEPTVVPTQPVSCGADDAVCHPPVAGRACCPDLTVHCVQGKCAEALENGIDECGPEGRGDIHNAVAGLLDIVCGQTCAGNDGYTCYGKPVIYLYPTAEINVDVTVTGGKIFVSDPLYPTDGWKNVLAKPSGELTYNGKTYNELFYESHVLFNYQPKTGIIIPSSHLETKLANIVYQLGLKQAEQKEFLDFWVPRLRNLNSPYIFFSLIDNNTKELNDHVEINPEPDTRIEFIAYFKPLDIPVAITHLVLPPRPQRIGFTEVEWGGTIDNERLFN